MGVSFRVVKFGKGFVTVIVGVTLNKIKIFNIPTKSFCI